MARRGVSVGMSGVEKILGGVLLAVYLVILPLGAQPGFELMEKLSGVAFDDGMRNAIYYYVLFALTAVAFWGYLGRNFRAFFNHIGGGLLAVGIGLVAFYGLNEIVWRGLVLLHFEQVNLNDQAILARLGADPYSTVLILVFLAPVVEEAVFRGYIFGNLREFNRAAAYFFSCFLFAAVHVWQYVVLYHDFWYLLVMVQYFVPGVVMAWTFERSESLWGSILLHCIVNGLAVWSVI